MRLLTCVQQTFDFLRIVLAQVGLQLDTQEEIPSVTAVQFLSPTFVDKTEVVRMLNEAQRDLNVESKPSIKVICGIVPAQLIKFLTHTVDVSPLLEQQVIPIVHCDSDRLLFTSFDYDKYQRSLTTQQFGRFLMCADVTTSTQAILSEYPREAY